LTHRYRFGVYTTVITEDVWVFTFEIIIALKSFTVPTQGQSEGDKVPSFLCRKGENIFKLKLPMKVNEFARVKDRSHLSRHHSSAYPLTAPCHTESLNEIPSKC
jgi:hypothetical protein